MNTHEHVFVQEAEIETDDGKEYIVVWDVCECGDHRFGGRFESQSATQYLLDLVKAG